MIGNIYARTKPPRKASRPKTLTTTFTLMADNGSEELTLATTSTIYQHTSRENFLRSLRTFLQKQGLNQTIASTVIFYLPLLGEDSTPEDDAADFYDGCETYGKIRITVPKATLEPLKQTQLQRDSALSAASKASTSVTPSATRVEENPEAFQYSSKTLSAVTNDVPRKSSTGAMLTIGALGSAASSFSDSAPKPPPAIAYTSPTSVGAPPKIATPSPTVAGKVHEFKNALNTYMTNFIVNNNDASKATGIQFIKAVITKIGAYSNTVDKTQFWKDLAELGEKIYKQKNKLGTLKAISGFRHPNVHALYQALKNLKNDFSALDENKKIEKIIALTRAVNTAKVENNSDYLENFRMRKMSW